MSKSMYNADLQFDEESASQWFHRLNEADKNKYREFARRLNEPTRTIPANYRGEVKRMAKRLNNARLNATEAPLSDEQVFEVDSFIAKTWYEEQVLAQILSPVTRTMSKPSWSLKWYTATGETYPEFTEGGPSAFRSAKSITVGVTPTYKTGIGGAIRYDLSWTLLAEAAGGIYDPANWHNIKATEMFGELWDGRLALGSACINTSGDIGVKGLCNAASAQTATSHADLTTAGDIDLVLGNVATLLRTAKEPGQNIFLSSSGIAHEMFLNDSGYTDRTTYERIKHKFFDSGIYAAWYVDDRICQATAAAATQRFCGFRLGEQAIRRHIIYPFQKKPLVNKEFADDVAYALLTADILNVINANAIVVSNEAGTTTSAGMCRNGLFMKGSGGDGGLGGGNKSPNFYPGGIGGPLQY
jgi:hypothetical protein